MRDLSEQLEDMRLIYEFLSETDKEVNADIIIVLGTHDLRVAEYAAKVYKKRLAPLLICSGGLGKVTEDIWIEPEGVRYANRCVELGVPEDAIIIEKESTNTGDNFKFSKKVLSDKGIYPKTGIIISKPYMAKRSWATASKQWPEVKWSVCSEKLTFDDYLNDTDSFNRNINLMIGDLQRMKIYVDKGFQTPVSISKSVWDAYERLVDDGYTKFIVR